MLQYSDPLISSYCFLYYSLLSDLSIIFFFYSNASGFSAICCQCGHRIVRFGSGGTTDNGLLVQWVKSALEFIVGLDQMQMFRIFSGSHLPRLIYIRIYSDLHHLVTVVDQFCDMSTIQQGFECWSDFMIIDFYIFIISRVGTDCFQNYFNWLRIKFWIRWRFSFFGTIPVSRLKIRIKIPQLPTLLFTFRGVIFLKYIIKNGFVPIFLLIYRKDESENYHLDYC